MSARILVIDDHPDNQKLMSYLLEKSGFDVVLASSGEEGLQLAQQQVFDLVLCDIRLPGIDGYEVARQLKSDLRCARWPIVAVSASTSIDNRNSALAAGFDGCINKAISPQLFIQQVQMFLPSSEP